MSEKLKRLIVLNYLGVIQCIDEVRDQSRKVGLDGLNATYDIAESQRAIKLAVRTLSHGTQSQNATFSLQPVLTPQLFLQVREKNTQKIAAESDS